MKTAMVSSGAIVVMLVALTTWCVAPAAADWNPGDYAKYVQMPDLSNNGVDIRFDRSDGIIRSLADDFPCYEKGLITDVHIWGSWQDLNSGVSDFWVTIHSDDPVGTGGSDPVNQWSKPDQALWAGLIVPYGTYDPGAANQVGWFTERLYNDQVTEFFWDPYEDPNGQNVGIDDNVWQYNMYIDPAKAFEQQGGAAAPITYWLEVFPGLVSQTNGPFGWKTRDWTEPQYMDDAVYLDATGEWLPLEYFLGHPLETQSLDLAFVITPEPATIALLGLGGLVLAARRRKA